MPGEEERIICVVTACPSLLAVGSGDHGISLERLMRNRANINCLLAVGSGDHGISLERLRRTLEIEENVREKLNQHDFGIISRTT